MKGHRAAKDAASGASSQRTKIPRGLSEAGDEGKLDGWLDRLEAQLGRYGHLFDGWCGDRLLPRVAVPSPDAADLERCAGEWMLSGSGLLRRSGRGRPSRSAPDRVLGAMRAAYLLDVAGLALPRPPWESTFGPAPRSRSYADPRGTVAEVLEAVTQHVTLDMLPASGPLLERRAVEMWRAAGRAEFARQGFWPWAIAGPEGRLARRWWREARYADVLLLWQTRAEEAGCPADDGMIGTR